MYTCQQAIWRGRRNNETSLSYSDVHFYVCFGYELNRLARKTAPNPTSSQAKGGDLGQIKSKSPVSVSRTSLPVPWVRGSAWGNTILRLRQSCASLCAFLHRLGHAAVDERKQATHTGTHRRQRDVLPLARSAAGDRDAEEPQEGDGRGSASWKAFHG